jgi:hypothetical protein
MQNRSKQNITAATFEAHYDLAGDALILLGNR